MSAFYDYFLVYTTTGISQTLELSGRLAAAGYRVWPAPDLSLSEIDNPVIRAAALASSQQALLLVGTGRFDLASPEFATLIERARRDELNRSFAGDKAFKILVAPLPSAPPTALETVALPAGSQLVPVDDSRLTAELGKVYRLELTEPTYPARLTASGEQRDNFTRENLRLPSKHRSGRVTGRERFLAGLCLLLLLGLGFSLFQWQGAAGEQNKLVGQTTAPATPNATGNSLALDQARSRELAAQSQLLMDTKPDLSLLLATEALKRSATPEAESALRQALTQPVPRTVPLVNITRGPLGNIQRFTLSPDLSRVAALAPATNLRGKGSIEIWNTEPGTRISKITGITGDNIITIFSPNGRLLFKQNFQGTSEMWEVDSARPLYEVKGTYNAAFSPDSNYFAYTDFSKTHILKASTGEETTTIARNTSQVYRYDNLIFSHDNQKLLVLADSNLGLWQVATGQKVLEFKGHTAAVLTAVFSPDGQFMASSSLDHTIRIWRVESGQEIRAPLNLLSSPGMLSISPDSQYLAINDSNMVQLYSLGQAEVSLVRLGPSGNFIGWSKNSKYFLIQSPEPNRLQVFLTAQNQYLTTLNHPGIVMGAGFTTGDREIVTVADDGNLRYWSLALPSPVFTITGNSPVQDIAFSPDGKKIAVATRDKQVALWDSARQQQFTLPPGHKAEVNRVLFSPDGCNLVTGGADGTVRISDSSSGALVTSLEVSQKGVTALAFSPDGKILATGEEGGEIHLWLVGQWQELKLLQGHKSSITSLSFSPDGQKLVSGSTDNSAIIWEIGLGKLSQRLEGHQSYVYSVAFSPDGGKVVTGSADYNAQIWDASTGLSLALLAGHRGIVWQVKFSQDGSRVLTSAGDNYIGVWNSRDGSLTRSFGGGRGYDLDGSGEVAEKISTDNRFSVVADSNTAQVWDVESGIQVAKYPIASGQLLYIAISPDNRKVVLGTRGGDSLVYDCPLCVGPADLLQEAQTRAPRLLTPEEKDLYFHN